MRISSVSAHLGGHSEDGYFHVRFDISRRFVQNVVRVIAGVIIVAGLGKGALSCYDAYTCAKLSQQGYPSSSSPVSPARHIEMPPEEIARIRAELYPDLNRPHEVVQAGKESMIVYNDGNEPKKMKLTPKTAHFCALADIANKQRKSGMDGDSLPHH